jgi:transcriptional regulator with XRE-family HTH domain
MAKIVSMEEQIRKAILASGLAQRDLAKQAGVSHAQISRFLAGERGLSLASAAKICRVVGLRLTTTKER